MNRTSSKRIKPKTTNYPNTKHKIHKQTLYINGEKNPKEIKYKNNKTKYTFVTRP